MPSTTSTLAPTLLAGPERLSEGPIPPPVAPVERRAVAERTLELPPELAAIGPAERETGAAPAAARVQAVIVHHRGSEMLAACLESLLASQRVDLQIVVVLNHCLESVPELARSSPALHLLELAESHGFGEANNLGVAWARQHLGPADFYYFVNNDTLSLPDTLPLLVDQLQAAPAAAIAGPQTLIESAPDFINSLGLNVTEDAWGWDEGIGIALCDYGPLPGVRRVMAVTGSALLIEAAAFDEIGGWSEVYDYYFEDIDLALKTWKRGREVLHVPDSVIFHRVSATMTVGAERKFFFFWRNRLLLAGIHWPLGMLLSVLKRAIVAEVIRRPWRDSALQRRALFGALLKTPGILRERWRRRSGADGWRRFLHPAGSVPRITLPQPGEVPAAIREAAAAAQRESAGAAGEGEGTEASPLPVALPAAELAESAEPVDAAAAIVQPARSWVVDDAALQRLRDFAAPAAEGRRLLVFGWSPLPFDNEKMNFAPGGRAWQFAAAVAAEGHAVALACAPIPGATFAPPPPCELTEYRGVLLLRLELTAMEDEDERRRLVEAFAPDALVGATPGPSAWAAAVAGELPLWVDFFGDPLAEGQAREAVYPELESFGAYSGLVAPLLRRGDAFSAVSRRQRLALIGQLGLAGRLSGSAAGQELVGVLPCAAEIADHDDGQLGERQNGAAEAEKGFLVLWGGGFNTWCDIPTLVEGLEAAMDQLPELRFVATGGEIAGHDDRTVADLRRRVAASRHAGRFELLGQVPRQEADAWLSRAHLTLITEKVLYERELGSSGRITGWLAAGKAILCSQCSEQVSELAEQGLILTYAAGNAGELARRLVEAATTPARLAELAGRARAYSREHLGYSATTAPLRQWAQQPRRAAGSTVARPEASFLVQHEVTALEQRLAGQNRQIADLAAEQDRLQRQLAELSEERAALEARRQELARNLGELGHELRLAREDFHASRSELGRIHQSKMWGWWMAYLGIRQRLRRLFGLAKTD